MINVNKMLASLSRSGMMKGSGGSLLTGGIAGGLAGGLMSKGGKKTSKKALKMGALAAVGGIAWKAYKSYSDQQAQDRAHNRGKYQDYDSPQSHQTSSSFGYEPNSLQESKFDDVVTETNTEGQLLLLRAMVAAAHADGHIDQTERMKIFDQVENMELSVEDKSSLFDEMRNPLSIEEIAAKVPCSEAATEVYAISALAVDLYQNDSRMYLDKLARMLCIPAELQEALERTANGARLSVHA
ncbi:MAG: uncharacterized membrane protein YebE (DUF533 family) [Glaciecola sp.]